MNRVGAGDFLMQLLTPPLQKTHRALSANLLLGNYNAPVNIFFPIFRNFQKSWTYCQISQNISKVLKTFPNFSKNLQIFHNFSQIFLIFLQFFLNFFNNFFIYKICNIFSASNLDHIFLKKSLWKKNVIHLREKKLMEIHSGWGF